MLLLALKICYPTQVHLLRGNHEDEQVNALYANPNPNPNPNPTPNPTPNPNPNPNPNEQVNALYGFRDECLRRCTEGAVVWRAVNSLFEYLPVAALIDSAVLCPA